MKRKEIIVFFAGFIILFIISFSFLSFGVEGREKDYRSEAYKYLELTFGHQNSALMQKYDVMFMDDIVTKEEFEYFKAEVLKQFPHLRPYVDMHDGKSKKKANEWLK